MKKALILGAMLTILLAGPAAAADPCATSISTASGQVSGLSEKDSAACVYRGIPYAAPPVGELRWRAPAPPVAWTGVRPSDKFGARCMQSGVMEVINADPSGAMSEDCLYLNVWRPKKSGSFPVMVWIHGGGYSGGTGNTPMYWGDRMAAAGDVVVVTFNYRLNIFGFLALPGLKSEDKNGSVGSYGSLDQVAALQWVHDNIQGFGGDPANVTVFGESAGGWSVCTMLATPLTRGLVHRAILESGGCIASASEQKGFDQGLRAAAQLGCDAGDLSCLRRLPADKVLKNGTDGTLNGFVWMPHHDGYLLKLSPQALIALGDYNRIPFMAGSNRQEVDALLGLLPSINNAKPEDYQPLLKKFLGASDEEAAELARLYPVSKFEDTGKAMGKLATDGALGCPTYSGLRAAAGQSGQTWFYRFDFHGMYLGEVLGAVHAMEVPFVFNTLDRKPISMLYPGKVKPEVRELSRVVQGYWLNFARGGDPNGGNLPAWPAFTPEGQMMQVLDTPVRSEAADVEQQCAFWNEFNQKHAPLFETMGGLLEQKP